MSRKNRSTMFSHEAEVGDGGAFGRVTQFRVPGEVADEENFVEIGHGAEARGALSGLGVLDEGAM